MAPVVVVPWLIGRDWIPLAFQWALAGLAFASALGLSLFFWKGSRTLWLALNFYDPTRPWTVPLAAVITLYVAGMATMGFAAVSAFLYLQGVATTSAARALAHPVTDTWWYYIWSLLAAVPALELPQTLGWEQPFRFTDPVNRVLLLVYKLALIGPVIAIVRLLWRGLAGPPSEAPASREGGPT